MTDPLTELVNDAAGLMNRAFVNELNPTSLMCEFYHQFRKLWDRGIPVGVGLGHLLIKPLDAVTLGITRLGEPGRDTELIATLMFDPRTTTNSNGRRYEFDNGKFIEQR